MTQHAPSGRPWARRHPFATGVLAISAAIFGLMLALPGDEDRGILLVGISAFALPIVAVVWLVTWFIDRRKASRADAAMAEASLAPSAIWPPAAAPVTPRDVASLFRNAPSPPTTPSAAFGAPSPPPAAPTAPTASTAPLIEASQDVASLWRTLPATPTPPVAAPMSDPMGALAPDAATVDLDPRRPATLAEIVDLSPTDLEQLCVRLLLALAYTDLVRTGGTGDPGTIVGRDPQGRSVVARSIRYTGDTLGTDTVQSFVATAAAGPHADRRILIATAEFSQPANRLASEHDVLLVDGDDLVKLLDLTGSR